jgi:two-component system OmpR family response regulator
MSRAKILVVDDEDICEFLAAALEMVGSQVRFAHEGHEALRCVEEFRPDLLVMNRMMPGLRGDEVATELLRRTTVVRVIIASGLARWGFEQEYYRLGICDLLVNPFGVPDLLARVERSLATEQTMIGALVASPAGTVAPQYRFG